MVSLPNSTDFISVRRVIFSCLQTVHLLTKDMNSATNATAFPNGNVNGIQHATTIVIMDRACRLDRAV